MRLTPVFSLCLLLAFATADASAVRVVVQTAPEGGSGNRAALRPFVERMRALGLSPMRRLTDGVPMRASLAAAGETSAGPRDPFGLDVTRVWLLEAPDSAAAAAALAGDPGIEWFELDQPREIAADPSWTAPDWRAAPNRMAAPSWFAALGDSFLPNDPLFLDGRQWGLRNLGPASPYRGVLGADIHATEAWAMTRGANDLLLAVADTGVDPNHPELGGLMPDGTPRIAYPFIATEDPHESIADSVAHGTAVSGVIAARTNNGVLFDSLGVAGVCGGDGGANAGCRLVPIRITGGASGSASSFTIARAILWATEVGARAVNISFAGGAPSRAERTAMHWAITHGCVVVAAAGNRGVTTTPAAPQYPAAYAAEGFGIQVGATDMSDRRAMFSSYGPGLDLVAPGLSIWTTYMTYPSSAGLLRNGFLAASGTSFAAPFVTGAVGLLATRRPELDDVDFQHLIRESADDVGAAGFDAETGWGRLNVARAMHAVPPTFSLWHDEVAAVVVSDTSAGAVLPTSSLVVGESGPGVMMTPRVWAGAKLVELRAKIAIPDSFVDSVRVWPRVGGTFSVKPGFQLPFFAPFAEVIERTERSFTIRGWLYRLPDSCLACGDEGWLPLPPDQARFGFTVIGKVARPVPAEPASQVEISPGLRLSPNPSFGAVRIESDVARTVEILDVTGRRIVRAELAPGRAWTWDGRDDGGDATPAGLYFVRAVEERGAMSVLRIVRLDSHANAP